MSLGRTVRGLVGRALLTLIDDAKRMQSVQIQTVGEEVTSGVERFQNYGLTSVPRLPDADGKGPEAIVLAVDGDRSHEVVIVVDDRRYRLKGLASGEVAVYDDLGQFVHLTRTGIVVSAPDIKLGAGATKGVNRAGDATTSSATEDATFWTWVTAVATATSTTAPTSLTGKTGAGSSVVKAVD